MSPSNNHVIIIGGGASGIMAAITAKRQGAKVTLLERNPRIGKKLLVTGNGRCNFTNINADISCYNGNNPKFAFHAISTFGPQATIDFFEKLGIAHKVEDMGKVFPMSDQASSFLDVFLYELKELGIEVITEAFVQNIEKNNNFEITLENGKTFIGNKVIIATGGKAMPSTGSDGNGYNLAKMLGHTIVETFPGLVQLKLEGTFFNQIAGVKFVGTAGILDKNKKILASDRGDILFANYGISGPPILQISRKAGELLQKNNKALLKVTIIDTLSKEDLRTLLNARFKNAPKKTIEFSLVGLVNKRLIPVLLKEAGITDLKSPAASISNSDIEKIAHILTDWRFIVTGSKSWPSAQVTAGGIDTNEINPKTMESKITKGLYFAGEIIDIDGQCGGFNLQWAWSSGFVAGLNAAL